MIENLVYDVGMNNGDDTAYYLARGCRVVAVEADPTYIEDARARFAADLDAGRLVLVNAAVGPIEGRATFHICDENRAWNTFDSASLARPGVTFRPIEVPVRRFENILAEHGVPTYLKVDIEGYDHYCLDAIDPGDRPRFLSWEIARLDELFQVRDLGYNAFMCISQSTLRPLTLGPTRGRPPGLAAREAKARFKSALADIPGVRSAVRAVRSKLRGGGGGGGGACGAAEASGNTARAASPIIRHVDFPPGSGARVPGWDFRFGSAGPFGPDQDHSWRTAEEVAYIYLDMWLHGGPEPGQISDWFDIHATTLPPDRAPKALWPPRDSP